MQISGALRDRHQALAEHFSRLARSRRQLPVFAIEHDLDETALGDLKSTVASQLEVDPQLQAAAWTWSYLPLLIMATEVGYRYRGTGTDFWPVLARELSVEPGHAFRIGISRLFEVGHRGFQLARPGDSAWERHFPHIAWPIGNALAPLEIQPHLTEALRRAIRSGISANNTETLVDHLKMLAAGHASRRFENWLQQGEIAFEVVRRLLAPDAGGWLSQGILRRLDDDIRGDVRSFRAITEARRTAALRSTRVTHFPSSQFVLSLVKGVPEQLLIRGPSLPSYLRDDVIAALRIQGDRLMTASSAHSIPLSFFLAGGEIALGSLGALPEPPLLRGDASQDPPGLAGSVLNRLQPRDASFFWVEPGEHAAHAVFPKDELPPDTVVLQWLGIDRDGVPEIRRLATSSETDAGLLRKQGFTILERKPVMRVLGLPMSGTQSRFAAGFPVLVAPCRAGLVPLLDGTQPALSSVRCRGVDWAVFRPGAGEHWVGPADADAHEKAAFQVMDPSDVEPASITALPAGATMADLESGGLEISITAPLPLEAVPVRLLVLAANQPQIQAETIIDRLPTRITGRSPLMQALRSQLAERSGDIGTSRLVVEARGLVPISIPLPPVHRDLRYDPASGRWISEIEEGRTLPSLFATPQAPMPRATSNDMTGFRLVLPDAPDFEMLPAGIVVSGEDTLRLGRTLAEAIEVPPLLREADSRDGRAGLVDTVRATIAWQLADAADPVSDWRRRMVVSHLEGAAIELLCGPAWRVKESTIDLSILSPHGALHRSAEPLGLISGTDLPALHAASDRSYLRNRLVARLRSTVPDIGDALAHWDDDLAANLDLAVIDAYDDLRLHLQGTGREAFDEVDMFRPADVWRRAFEDALRLPLLPMFRRFILPEARWSALVNPWYDDLSEDDLVDLLDACHVDASRRPGQRWIGRPELRAMLQLWISQRAMVDAEHWPRLLVKGLSDPQTARAVRYVALRYKLTRLDLRDGDEG